VGPSCQRNEVKAAGLGRREPKRKTYSVKYAKGVRGLSDLGRPVGFSLGERREASGLVGPTAEWAAGSAGPKIRKNEFPN
jgi:hypothetical protein